MADSTGNSAVTRKEFYSALSLIWLYITLVIGQLLNEQSRWTMYVLFVMALVMSLMFSAVTIWLARKPASTDKPA